MGLFGRRRRRESDADDGGEYDYDEYDNDEYDNGEYDGRADEDSDQYADGDVDGDDDYQEIGGDLFDGAGPFDVTDAPEDGLHRIDLGSLRLPVPHGAQIQVEMDPSGPVRAVHVITEVGQLTLHGYAAPRSTGLWREVSTDLAEQLRSEGATVRTTTGEWGLELVAALREATLRFVGVDGPRWMLRGVVAGPPDRLDNSAAALYEMVRGTIVVRGIQPMPVGTPLPLELPPAIAQHIAQSQGEQG